MKRIKIMLMSLTVLAVVGGALAFKAKKFEHNYCIATQQGKCSTFLPEAKPTTEAGTIYYTFESPANPDDCLGVLNCDNSIKLTTE